MGRVRYLAIALLALCGLALWAQDRVFRVDVKLVRVLATVKNQQGQPVGNLRKEDFSVTDNGVPQEIAVFERHTAQPLSIGVMVDTSGSTAKELKYETDSVSRFARALFREGNPQDRLALYTFNWEVRRHVPYTRKVAQIDKAMKRFKAEAGTSMYDAIVLGAEDIEEREGRHVLVLITDGGDTISRASYHDALQAIHRADAVLYAILVLPIVNEAGRNIGGENALTTLTQSTGGKVFAPSLGAGIDSAFDDILSDLRTQYMIGFYPRAVPPAKDAFHRLNITVKGRDLRVIARTGYYGDSE